MRGNDRLERLGDILLVSFDRDVFERYILRHLDADQRITAADLIRLARECDYTE